MIHAVEVAFQSIHVGGPEAAELIHMPCIHLLERFRFQACRDGAARPPWTLQNRPPAALADALTRKSAARIAKLTTLDLSNGLFCCNQETQYRAAGFGSAMISNADSHSFTYTRHSIYL